MDEKISEENRISWNAATRAYNLHRGDQVNFFREGGSTLFPEELSLLGNIAGLSLIHLLCNSGQDTLSLAQLGANVSGVDISDEAITFARNLSEASNILATFYRADIFDWLEESYKEQKKFDVAYCSYGAIRWIANISRWMKDIASILHVGGRFVMVDFHPVAMMFDRHWKHRYPYGTDGQILAFNDGVGTIASSADGSRPFNYDTGDSTFRNTSRSTTFTWGLGEIITALSTAGFHTIELQEYLYSRYRHFDRMDETPDHRTLPPKDVPDIPLLYGIVARKVDASR